jgi:hypothetical protein
MSRSRRLRRLKAVVGLAFELICLFVLGFLASSVVGVALAWMLGLHHPEPNPLDEDSGVTMPYAEGRVSWVRPADPTAREEYGGSRSSWGFWQGLCCGGLDSTQTATDRPRASRQPAQ